jgi:hypothetical protein
VTAFYDFLAPFLGFCCGLALFILIVLLLRGPARKFWVVLLYASCELLATIGLTLADLFLHGTTQVGQGPTSEASKLYARLYWTNDVIEDLLRFVLVTVLIYMVVGSSRPLLGRMLGLLVLAMTVLPFVLFHPTFQPVPRVAWYNSTSQLLNFGAAIMNVILWGAIIQKRKRDPQILAVSIGLGLLVTGTAVSYGLRHFVPTGGFTAVFNLFLNLIQLAAWLIWCHAFWPARKATSPDPARP